MVFRPPQLTQDTQCNDCRKRFSYPECRNNKCPYCQSPNIKVIIYSSLDSSVPQSVQELQDFINEPIF